MLKTLETLAAENKESKQSVIDFIKSQNIPCILTGSISNGIASASSDIDIICFGDENSQLIAKAIFDRFNKSVDLAVFPTLEEFFNTSAASGYELDKLIDSTPIGFDTESNERIKKAQCEISKIAIGKKCIVDYIISTRYKIPHRFNKDDYGDDIKYYFGGISRIRLILRMASFFELDAKTPQNKLDVLIKRNSLKRSELTSAVELLFQLYSFASQFPNNDKRSRINQYFLYQFYEENLISAYLSFEAFEKDFYNARYLIEQITTNCSEEILAEMKALDPDFILNLEFCRTETNIDKQLLEEFNGDPDWYKLMLYAAYSDKISEGVLRYAYFKISSKPKMKVVSAIFKKKINDI